MDIARLGIEIDPGPAKAAAEEVKDTLVQIATTAEQTQQGVTATFKDEANNRVIVIRDAAAASSQAETAAADKSVEQASRRSDAQRKAAADYVAARQAEAAETMAALERQAALEEALAVQQKTAAADAAAAKKKAAADATAVMKQAANEQAAAAKKAATEERQAQADREAGFQKVTTGVQKFLMTLGLVSPEANRALMSIQGIESGLSLLGGGAIIAAGSVAALIAAFAGLTAFGVIWKGIEEAANVEPLVQQLGNAVGSLEQTETRLNELQQLAHDSGGLFDIQQLTTVNKELQTFTAGALAGSDGMRLIANASIAASEPIATVGAAIGKLYGAIQDKNPIDRYVKQLLTLRLINQDTANDLINLQRKKASPDTIWQSAQQALQIYNGGLEQYASTWHGLWGQVKTDITQALEALGSPLLPVLESALRQIEPLFQRLIPLAASFGSTLASGLAHFIALIESGQVGDFLRLSLQVGFEHAIDYGVRYFQTTWKTATTLAQALLESALTLSVAPLEKALGATMTPEFWKPLKDTLLAIAADLQAALNPAAWVSTQAASAIGAKITQAVHPGTLPPDVTTGAAGAASGSVNGFPAIGTALTPAEAELGAIIDKVNTAAEQMLKPADTPKPSAPKGLGGDELIPKTTTGLHGETQVKSDAMIMQDFIDQLNQLTYKLQTGEMSQTEFANRRFKLQEGTVNELADPGAANAAYSDPKSQEKAWQDLLNKWLVFQAQKKQAAEMADKQIAAGDATWEQSFERGVQKATEAWGNAQQQMEKLAEGVTNEIANGLTQGITDFITGAKDAKTAFLDMTKSILESIAKMIIQMEVQLAIQYALKAAGFAGFSGGGSVGGSPTIAPAGHAVGGMISGGSGGIDDIPAMLTAGEYVIQKSAVEKYGVAYLDQLNQGKLTSHPAPAAFASGGLVSMPTPPNTGSPTGGAPQVNIAIHVDASSGNSTADVSSKNASNDDENKGRKLADAMQQICVQVLQREMRQGGILANHK